jgi:hypothetical protein
LQLRLLRLLLLPDVRQEVLLLLVKGLSRLSQQQQGRQQQHPQQQ